MLHNSLKENDLYNPPRFKANNPSETITFLSQNIFATLITVSANEPFISHVPLVPKESGGKIELIGHIARANQHWKSLSGAKATAIFHGPHTYITPKWYEE